MDIPRDPAADPLMLAAGFLNHHPDLRFRLQGQKAYVTGARAKARDLFERAAMYGDKPSQGLIAEMLWSGDGIPKDRALAYAWMDLAAERAYRPLLVLRERYWEAMDAQERTVAIQRGVALYERYGDAVAKPRLASILRRGRMHTTGSRTGFTGNLTVIVPWGGGEMSIPGSQFYDARYWQPDQYWAWQDAVWKNPRTGVVKVGSVENASEAPLPKKASDEAGKDD
ncbi:MAG: hypothetical protein ABIO75_01525 [Thermomonas sp.]